MFTVTTLTAATAAKRLKDDGLGALGLTAPLLSPRWSGTSPAGTGGTTVYDAAAMTLTLADGADVHAPFRCFQEFLTAQQAAEFTGADGHSLVVQAAAFRLHPQAAQRLRKLVEVRYGTPRVRPVAVTVLVHEATEDALGAKAAHTLEGDEVASTMPSPAVLTFHDERGQIVDPIATAAMYADLLAAFPALKAPGSTATTTEDGGLAQFAALASGVRVAVTDLHGSVFVPATANAPVPETDPMLVVTDASAIFQRELPANGLLDLAPTERLAASTGDKTTARLRWGFTVDGTLSRSPLAAPALPTTGTPPVVLARQFLRVCAVDLSWHLLGNRSDQSVLGVPPGETANPGELIPQVRDRLRLDYLDNGMDVLASAGQVLARFTPGLTDAQAFAVSPDLEPKLGLPPAAGSAGHWPAFPAPAGAGQPVGFGVPAPDPALGITAVWAAPAGSERGADVLVTIVGSQVPAEAHVRIYPQRFVPIASIGPEPSFVRGDGGAAIAAAGTPVTITLVDPFGQKARPDPVGPLLLDIVVAPRVGRRRLFAAVPVTVKDGVPAPGADPFTAATDPLALVDPLNQSVCRVPLFGLPRVVPPSSTPPTSAVDMVRHFLSEKPPREGPRLPTMARFETVLATGLAQSGSKPEDPLEWDAVLTGGRWARETRSAAHREGNPGNPAGQDLHVSGLRVGGALAYDLALTAVRRAQPMLPVPPSVSPGWLVTLGKGHLGPPKTPDSDTPVAGQPALTGVGVALRTVAAVCETPELSTVDDSSFIPKTFDELLDALAKALKLSKTPSIAKPSSTVSEDRILQLARQEFATSKHGARDAVPALRRALSAARELVYIESPQFARTADAAAPGTMAEDLVELLAGRLANEPGLRVVLALPRLPDNVQPFGGWVLQALRARTQAVTALRAAAPDRVVVFHPVGFPGRNVGIRTTTVVVDDVWSLCGATHWRRRGMTFDGSVAVASFDRKLVGGYSARLRDFRRRLMAAKLGVPVPSTADSPTPDWVRLGTTAGAFGAVTRLLKQGGLGRVQPFWPGPTDITGATTDAVADPDGREGASLVVTLGGILNEPMA